MFGWLGFSVAAGGSAIAAIRAEDTDIDEEVLVDGEGRDVPR